MSARESVEAQKLDFDHNSLSLSSSDTDPFANDSDKDPEFSPSKINKKKRVLQDYFNMSTIQKKSKQTEAQGEEKCNDKSEKFQKLKPSCSTRDPECYSEGSQNEELREKFSNSALFDGKFFSIINFSGKYVKVKCELCTKETHLKGLCSVNSNFIKHLRNVHKGSYEAYEKYRREKKTTSKKDSTNSNSLKQQKLPEIKYATKKIKQNQKEFDEKLVKFIVTAMVPVSIVDQPTFRDLFSDSNKTIMSRRSLVRKIDDEYMKNMNILKNKIIEAKYVCTTADIWSAKRRSFFGVTCHWLDQNLKRHSAALACRRFAGTHSHDRIADLLEEIHSNFNLDNNKIIATITDNGSNFVKAFKEYGLKIKDSEDEIDFDSEEEACSLNFHTISSDDDSSDKYYLPLPKHYRCASHTLNLLATTDVNKAINKNVAIRSRHERVIQKCNVIWNKAGRPKSAEIIKNVLGHTLSYPAITRWNSFYKSIAQIIEEKDKLRELCHKLEIKDHFKETEIQYLEEYCTILKPVADTLNFLQGENNCFYGYLLPSIISLKVKLEKLCEDASLRNLKIILDEIIKGLKNRFLFFFTINKNSRDAIIAATTLPCVKLRWMNVFKETDEDVDFKAIINIILDNNINLFTTEILNSNNSNVSPEQGNPSYEFNFFDFKEDPLEKQDEIKSDNSNDLIRNKIELELLRYLEDKRTNLDMLQDYPLLKQIFLKYNTSLPSSAPVERLFSFATYINCPRRHALNDELFEKLVFLKGNVFDL